jgi:hyperosmotically inducible periplasmic protein
MKIENGKETNMMEKTGIKAAIFGFALAVLLLGSAGISSASIPNKGRPLDDAVRHELLMLPYYDVFDLLSFTIDGSSVITLTGQVTRPSLRADAETAVRSISSVAGVVNKIEVLPLSTFDNSIRAATYRAIFCKPGFEKYSIRAIAPIRIIVKNGNITLEGSVDNTLDRQMALMAARLVPGAFSVTDHLTII